MRAAIAFLLTIVALLAPALALDLQTGALPIHIDLPRGLPVDATTLVVVEGHVEATSPIVLVLRIDDDWSDGYASRVNEERLVPPGPFRWTVPLRGLKTSGGRLLRDQTLRRIHLFNASPKGRADVTVFRFEEAPALPVGTVGFSLGASDAPLFPGFERIAPGDGKIVYGKALPVRRPGVDPLIGSGLRDVQRLVLPWPAGRAAVTLWVEDVGEWETLPYALRRRIRINGIDVLDETLTPEEWIDGRYLRGLNVEYRAGDDSWEAYGRRRGGQFTVEVPIAGDGISIELAGDGPLATFLSAVLIEPAGSTSARDQVDRQRREWFVNAWPVALANEERRPDLPLLAQQTDPAMPPLVVHARTAAGTGTKAQFRVASAPGQPEVTTTVELEEAAKPYFSVDLWVAQTRLDRVATGENLLRPDDSLLRAAPSAASLRAGEPRRHVAWISAAATTPAGTYWATLRTTDGRSVRLQMEVSNQRLPAAGKAAGFYLETPPHLGWFSNLAPEANRQLGCDMSFLARLGITGNAPPLPAPFANRESDMIAMSKLASQNATKVPWLAYAAAKRLRESEGAEGSARQVEATLQALKAAGLPAPVWSIADEPSNPDQGGKGLREWVADLRNVAPQARLAGHLNASADIALLSLFDVVLVNQGYGIDLERLQKTAGKGRDVWLYNTGKPRFSAGLWLWRTPATRYLQWHARMPTADPFDPTDGREGDVQALLPGREVCAATPDINESVLDMAEGLVDQRWLAWLDTEPRAADLRARILARLGTEWKAASTLDGREMDDLRRDIETLARTLK